MEAEFFARPILSSPNEMPTRHWELDGEGQPTSLILAAQRRSDLITPVPKAKRQEASKDKVEVSSRATRVMAS